jgi:hypothetical protein
MSERRRKDIAELNDESIDRMSGFLTDPLKDRLLRFARDNFDEFETSWHRLDDRTKCNSFGWAFKYLLPTASDTNKPNGKEEDKVDKLIDALINGTRT